MKNKYFLSVVTVFSLLLLVFWGVWGYEFVHWDDSLHVYENDWVVRPLVESLPYFWTHIHEGLFIPFTYTVWSLVYHFHETFIPSDVIHFSGFLHIVNLVVHALNGVIVILISRALGIRFAISVFIGILFLIHPAQMASVCWISELKGLLSAFGVLIATLHFLKTLNTSKTKWLISSFLFFLISILSKPSYVAIPGIWFILLFISENKLGIWKREVILFFSTLFLSVLGIAMATKKAQPDSVVEEIVNIPTRLILVFHTLGFYITSFVKMPKYSLDYGHSPFWVITHLGNIFYWLVVPGILLVSTLLRKKDILFFVVSLLLAILPVSGIIPFAFQRFSLVADRYMYLFVAILLIGTFYLIKNNIENKVVLIPLVLAVLIAVPTSFSRKLQWQNSELLTFTSLEGNEDCEPCYVNATKYYLAKGDYVNATKVAYYIMRIKPELLSGKIVGNLGLAYEKQEDHKRAEIMYKMSIGIDSTDDIIHNNLGHFYLKKGMNDSSIIYIKNALRLNPANSAAMTNLGLYYIQTDHPDTAIGCLQYSLALSPLSKVHNYPLLALAYDEIGENDSAVIYAKKTLDIRPNDTLMTAIVEKRQ